MEGGGTRSARNDAADRFYDDIVSKTVEEFGREQGDVRRGVLAALAVSSLLEHIWEARHAASVPDNKKRDASDDFARHHCGQSPDLDIVREVANATKHVVLRGKNKRKLKGFNDLRRDGYVEDDYAEEGYFEEGKVAVALDDGDERRLAPLIDEAVRYLRALP